MTDAPKMTVSAYANAHKVDPGLMLAYISVDAFEPGGATDPHGGEPYRMMSRPTYWHEGDLYTDRIYPVDYLDSINSRMREKNDE